MCSLFLQTVQVLASVTKTTKSGVSTWDFVKKDDGSFAAVKRELQEKVASSEQDLRNLYSSFVKKYGLFFCVLSDRLLCLKLTPPFSSASLLASPHYYLYRL